MNNAELTVIVAAIMGLCGNVPRDPTQVGENVKAVLDCAEALIGEMHRRQATYDSKEPREHGFLRGLPVRS